MSIYGCLFLLLSIICGALSIGTALPDMWEPVAKGGTVFFCILFVISLLIGRRIKFDPVLR